MRMRKASAAMTRRMRAATFWRRRPRIEAEEVEWHLASQPLLRIRLLGEECAHLTKHFIPSVDEDGVVSVGEHHDPAVWNLSAEMFDFLLVIFPLCFEKLLEVLSLRLGQRFSPVYVFLVTDGEERKRWRLNFAV